MKTNPSSPPPQPHWNAYVDQIEAGVALVLISSPDAGEQKDVSSLRIPVAWLPAHIQENTWFELHLRLGVPPSSAKSLRTALGKADDGKNFSL